ncbi:MAG: adenylate kinase [Paludibacteraceae bacterium]|nr:adenylate kinase [Paludibacteraceae bacterium]
MLNIVMFGAPGAGKGTQSELIEKRYNLIHLSTGDILRAEIKNGSELGKQVEAVISKGQLVSDELIIALLEQEISRHADANGFIFDGFPRTQVQAGALDEMLAKHGEKVSIMLALSVEENELIKRLLNRGATSGRADDNLETIRKRITVYNEQTAPVMKYYEQKGLLRAISNDTTVEECFAQVCKAIDAAKA